jgi:hypothetical protein
MCIITEEINSFDAKRRISISSPREAEAPKGQIYSPKLD